MQNLVIFKNEFLFAFKDKRMVGGGEGGGGRRGGRGARDPGLSDGIMFLIS